MSYRRAGTVLAILTSIGFAFGAVATSAQDHPVYTAWYEGLRDLAPDRNRGATVENLVLERDVGSFLMESGQINLLEAIDGRTVGAVFVGEGRFEMAAPEQIEQDQLERTYGRRDVSTDIESAVFLFTDFTLSELEGKLAFGTLAMPGGAAGRVEDSRDYFTDGDGWVDPSVLMPLINEGPGFFRAHIEPDGGDPMIFTVDPHFFEEISLARPAEAQVERAETVTQFHRMVDYSTGRSIPQEALDLIAISKYDIETTIEGNLDIAGRATLDLVHRMPTYDWVRFMLYYELEVDSVRWGDGSAAEFHRPEESQDLWVDFSTMPEGETSMTFFYEGDMMEQPRDLWVQLMTHYNWFPIYRAGPRIPYTLTFHTPDDYMLTTVGTKLDETVGDDVITTRWETPPVRLVTFNIGDFDEHVSEPPSPGEPGLSVLIDENSHHRYADDLFRASGRLIFEQEDMPGMVALDVRNSFRFFNEVFGPTTVQDFVATEIPYLHGEAYQGLVMMAWSTFQWTSSRGFDQLFRAHEVAHQWWGIGVQPATYRDRWISEGFSEFSGWWYAARAQGSMPMFMERLETTREAIMERRGRSAPIALGNRTANSRYPEDYQRTIYHKGAWVLHMLRVLLTDPDTGNDDAFVQVMQEFYTRHLGGTASTLGFQQVAEEVTGFDLEWFFQQWVYGSHIPTYTFAYRLDEQPDGWIRARVRVVQEDVPDDFRMIVPILVDFGDDGSAMVRINVQGPVTEADLPLFPREPDNIEFNPFESVLAETKTAGWPGS